MSGINGFQKLALFVITAVLLTVCSNTSFAEDQADCEVTLSLPDTVSEPYTEITIPVYFDNFVDSLRAIAIWIQSSRSPNVMAFLLDTVIVYDTTYWKCNQYSGPDCIDSTSVPVFDSWDFMHVDTSEFVAGLHDTTGTLVSGWEYVDSRSLSSNGTDILVVAVADLPGLPFTAASPTQQGGILVNIRAHVFDDTELFTDSIINLYFNTYFLENFNIFLGDGEWTPFIGIPVADTNCFVCTQWDIDNSVNPPDTLGCLNWQQTALGPCDSVEITEDTLYVLDSNRVCVSDGSIKIVPPPVCGDLNGDGTGPNVIDLNFFINCIFRGMCPEVLPIQGDVNCDTGVNILDMNIIINYIFRLGPKPTCECP